MVTQFWVGAHDCLNRKVWDEDAGKSHKTVIGRWSLAVGKNADQHRSPEPDKCM
jgi:hypothetical protein